MPTLKKFVFFLPRAILNADFILHYLALHRKWKSRKKSITEIELKANVLQSNSTLFSMYSEGKVFIAFDIHTRHKKVKATGGNADQRFRFFFLSVFMQYFSVITNVDLVKVLFSFFIFISRWNLFRYFGFYFFWVLLVHRTLLHWNIKHRHMVYNPYRVLQK